MTPSDEPLMEWNDVDEDDPDPVPLKELVDLIGEKLGELKQANRARLDYEERVREIKGELTRGIAKRLKEAGVEYDGINLEPIGFESGTPSFSVAVHISYGYISKRKSVSDDWEKRVVHALGERWGNIRFKSQARCWNDDAEDDVDNEWWATYREVEVLMLR